MTKIQHLTDDELVRHACRVTLNDYEVVELHERLTLTCRAMLELSQRLLSPPPAASPRLYFSPVGTLAERESEQVWPGDWVDATGYLVWYFGKWWHTGADLNLNKPHWDADRLAPVYAIGDGEIYAVRTNVTGWGSVICIRHEHCLSRYAHCTNIVAREGEAVERGDRLANIGNAGGRYPYHLHFDVTRLDARMAEFPLDWPGADKSRVERDYLDPLVFLRDGVG